MAEAGGPEAIETRVVVVDQYGGLHRLVEDALAATPYEACRIAPLDFATNGSRTGPPAVTIINLCLPADELTLLRQRAPSVNGPRMVVSGCESMSVAASLLIPGADRYITLPVDGSVLRELVLTLAERISPVTPKTLCGMVGKGPAFRRLKRAIEQVAASDATVLLIGETGTGKEMAARAVHELSDRTGPFVAVDGGALSESLLESELFGHVKGAFTGATRGRRGLFEEANRGTLFLDQIDDVSQAVQIRLLRTIQEREIRRVGSPRPTEIDVRLVAASRVDLESEVAAGRFRKDLFYRLHVYPIRIPPLRERMEDLPLLVDEALARHGRVPDQCCSTLAHEILRSYDWPGNIRQLFSVIQSATIRAGGGVVDANHLPIELIENWREQANSTPSPDHERRTLDAVLEETDGNRTRAAEILGVSRTTLWRRLKRRGDGVGR